MNLEWRTLAEVLVNIDDEPMSGEIFVKEGYPWNADTLCVVLSIPEEEYHLDGGSDFTKQNSLKPALRISNVFEIVDYARGQKSEPTVEELVASFNHYYKHDAFLNLSL
jgi:hypothetical protein